MYIEKAEKVDISACHTLKDYRVRILDQTH